MERDRLFLLDGLTEEEKAQCWALAQNKPQTFQKGKVIYDSKRAQRALALVINGNVRVQHGRVVMNELCAGDVFGAAALFGDDDPFPTTVTAQTTCSILFIPQKTVSAWMSAVPRIGENYIRFLSDRIRFLNRRLSTLTAGHTDGKLWRYLLTHRDADGIVRLTGGVTELARILDMGRSSLYRCLDALTDAGKIQRHGKEITVVMKGD